ncbi:MAG: TadE family protein [Janthinobacterium lividum]
MTRTPDGSAPRGAGRGDEGSAVAEFAAVAGILALLFAAVVQLAVVQHVRSTAVDCAGEGARYGALTGNSPELGAQRTRELLAGALSPRFADDVSAQVRTRDGVEVVEVRVRAPLPVIAFLGVGRVLDVRGHALQEGGLA